MMLFKLLSMRQDPRVILKQELSKVGEPPRRPAWRGPAVVPAAGAGGLASSWNDGAES